MVEEITSKTDFEKIKKENSDFLMVIFYTDSSENSKKSLDALKAVKEENPETPIYSVNASKVKDIHPDYGIHAVPAVLVIKKGDVSKIIYGVQTKEYYSMLLYDAPIISAGGEEKKQHRIVVYTSPSCPWCNKLKTYLRKHHIMFREVDVARDQKAAQDLVRRSGQTGTPQTDIDGRIIVGFDKPKLDEILGIREG